MTDSRSNDLSLVLRATVFAAEKHRSQRRKDREASPYINHPIAVATVLVTTGAVTDPVCLAAALLHDTLEDTRTTPDELESAFDADVRSLVEEVTDDKSLPKHVRKDRQVEYAPRSSHGAKLIKLADKICNVRDVTDTPPADWSIERRLEYLDWTERVIAGCRGTNATLERCYDDALARARSIVGVDGAEANVG